jgi:hypothetical protein
MFQIILKRNERNGQHFAKWNITESGKYSVNYYNKLRKSKNKTY